jgi:hypothetical protein
MMIAAVTTDKIDTRSLKEQKKKKIEIAPDE